MTFTITVSEKIALPEGSTIAYAESGAISGYRLPDGRLIRPWISYEIEEEDGDNQDLSYDELLALGIETGLDIERDIQEAT